MTISSNTSVENVQENTEVIYGQDNIIRSALKVISKFKNSFDICVDSEGPSMFMAPDDPIFKALVACKGRGVNSRIITEIKKENIVQCKQLMNDFELRHLDDVKGNFGIGDGIYYRASPRLTQSSPPPLLISSTVREFVEQQQYFFDMLWKKAIPARQRIKEIEEHLKREFIETIQDSEETITLVSRVLSSATEEIQLLFSRAGTLKQYEGLGILNILREKAEKDVAIRILIGTDIPIRKKDIECLSEHPQIQLRYLIKSIKTRLTTIVTDRELSLVVEDKDQDSDDLGFATYSNSGSTVLSYASVFENLWAQSTTESDIIND